MTSTGSISLSGLLGGTAGSIDTTSLITSLMSAESVPQTQLQDQLTTTNSVLSAYQEINSKIAAVQKAAQALTDPTSWQATSATSSSTAVVATSDDTASVGSTTFSVTKLAKAQITTVPLNSDGTVVGSGTTALTFSRGDGRTQTVNLTSGSAADVASAINTANVGIRASVVTTDSGPVLQLSAGSTGADNSFTTSDFSNTPTNLTSAQNAQVTVGDVNNGGYTVSSSSNTFTGLVSGVTFSANALASDVTITVGSDEKSISDKVQSLVDSVNTALTSINAYTGQGGVLEGQYDVRALADSLDAAVSAGTSGGGSLKTYGVDIDSKGVLSFDASAFATAYTADPTATQSAISGSFASSLATTSTSAVDATSGSITQSITLEQSQATRLQSGIDDWTTKLATIKDGLTTKFTAMETALAKLQSQQTYLTSMFNSINNTSSSSSSSSN